VALQLALGEKAHRYLTNCYTGLHTWTKPFRKSWIEE
jgi:hypothetical protein